MNGKPVALDDGVYSRKVSEWQYLDVANISLEQGKNTITIQAIAGGFTYMDDVVIECPVTLVASESKLVKSIAVTQDPTKVVYACGEKFNPAGMAITATRADGTTFAVERFKYDNSPLDTVGAVEVTVWAENCEVKIPVTVEDIKAGISAYRYGGETRAYDLARQAHRVHKGSKRISCGGRWKLMLSGLLFILWLLSAEIMLTYSLKRAKLYPLRLFGFIAAITLIVAVVPYLDYGWYTTL